MQYIKISKWIFLLSSLLGFISCNKMEEPKVPVKNFDNENSQKEDNSENNKPDEPEKYYFKPSMFSYNPMWLGSGKDYYSFKCNQPWTITTEGNYNEFSITPTEGFGDGCITMTYGEAKFTRTYSGGKKWDERQTIIFHIREGNVKHWNQTNYSVYLHRYGETMGI